MRVIFILLLSGEVVIREVLLLGLLLLVIDGAFVVLRRMLLLNIEDVLVHLEWFGGPLTDGLVEAIEAAGHLLLGRDVLLFSVVHFFHHWALIDAVCL